MESVRLKINEHMMSVGEDILCVLDKPQLKLHVRVFVLERLSAAAVFVCNLFQREMETLEKQLELEKQNKLDIDMSTDMDINLHTADQRVESSLQVTVSTSPAKTVYIKQEPEDMDLNILHVLVCKEEVTPEEETSPSLDQEEPRPLQIKYEQEELLERPGEASGSTSTLLALKIEGDNENRETEPVASTSSEHMKTQADVEDCGTSQPTGDDRLLSTHCSESYVTEDSDGWEQSREDQSALKTLKLHEAQNVGEQRNLSQDLKSSKQTHSMNHTGSKTFSCTECEKTFNHKGHLKRHIMIHTGEKPFSCTVCGKGFALQSHLKTHMTIHTVEKPFPCTVCGKGYANTSILKTHMMTHTGKRPFSCTVCGKGFNQKGGLKIHMMTHTGANPFSCTVCGKGFAEKCSIDTHMRTHTGERPFSCSVCGKGFCKKSSLKTHMIVHTGVMPFSCTVCGKGYVNTSYLKAHMRTHTGEKPFSCKNCSKGFADMSNLKRHMRSHTGGSLLV